MESTSLETILTQAAVAAADGEMDDSLRVLLYKLALTVACEELYRIEEMLGGTVAPGALLVVQQLAMLADPDADIDEMIESMQHLAEQINEEASDSGGGVTPTS